MRILLNLFFIVVVGFTLNACQKDKLRKKFLTGVNMQTLVRNMILFAVVTERHITMPELQNAVQE